METFDQDYPYNFKWGWNGETGEPEVWKVFGGHNGRPAHRNHLLDTWGRKIDHKLGDVIGEAMHRPAKVLEDGSVLKPATVKVVTYYGKTLPPSVEQWFGQQFPEAQISDLGQDLTGMLRDSKLADTFVKQAHPEGKKTKWLWGPDEGAVVWRTDERGLPSHANMAEQTWGRTRQPTDSAGHVEEDHANDSLAIESHFGVPPAQCLADVKTELAKQQPDRIITLPQTDEAKGIEPSFGTDGPRLGALYARWAWPGGAESNAETREAINRYDRPRLSYTALAGADMSGAMVAVYVPERVAKKLLIDHEDAEPIERMHVTLAYFKDKAADRDDWHELEQIVEKLAGETARLSGKIGGYGVFSNPEEGDVLWASPSVDGLAELREAVVAAAEKGGFKISREHGWTPHITLQYGFEGELPKLDGKIEIEFEHLAFARGDNKTDHALKTAGYAPHSIPFVTDGKNLKIDMKADEFLRMFPPEDRDYARAHSELATGWINPTDDGLGYGVHSSGGFNPERPGANDIMALLDEETGKPCHFV